MDNYNRLQAQLDAALDRLAAAEAERDTVAGMTIAVYVVLAVGFGLLGFALGYMVG